MHITENLDPLLDGDTASDITACHEYFDELAPYLQRRREAEDYTARILAHLRSIAARSPQVSWGRVMSCAMDEDWTGVGEESDSDLIVAGHLALEAYVGDLAWWALIEESIAGVVAVLGQIVNGAPGATWVAVEHLAATDLWDGLNDALAPAAKEAQ